jgi:hypothetical protein
MSQKLKEYAELQSRIKADKARMEVIKTEIEEEFGQQEHVEKTEFGTFKMVGRKNWTYSEAAQIMKEDLKILEVEEQEQGIATHTTSYSLRFNAKKAV